MRVSPSRRMTPAPRRHEWMVEALVRAAAKCGLTVKSFF
jgi:hypothetical protein